MYRDVKMVPHQEVINDSPRLFLHYFFFLTLNPNLKNRFSFSVPFVGSLGSSFVSKIES